jgi:hypothetical protein
MLHRLVDIDDVVSVHLLFPDCETPCAARKWIMFPDSDRVCINQLARTELG